MTPAQAIESLLSSGMTEAAIAAKAGAQQSTINRIKRHADPRWSLGQRLVQLAGQRRTTKAIKQNDS